MRRLRNEDGSSLTELLIVMLILSVIILTVGSLSIGMWRTNAEVMTRQDQVDSARSAVERMSKTLRTAVKPSQLVLGCAGCTEDAFIKAQSFAMQFYANLDNSGNSKGPSRVTYSVAATGSDAGVLIEKVQVPDSNVAGPTGYAYCAAEAPGASPECTARLSVRRLAEGVIVDSAQPLFSYFDESSSVLTTGGGLSSSQIAHLLSVEVTLNLRKPNNTTVAPTTYLQRIMLPNAQAVLRPW